MAASMGLTEIAALLLAAGASLEQSTANGQTAVFYAVSKGHVPMVQLLLERGAQTSIVNRSSGEGLMHRAVALGHGEIARLLLQHNRKLLEMQDGEGRRPLHWAASEDFVDLLHWLLAEGARSDATDRAGRRPLDSAVSDAGRAALRGKREGDFI